MKLTSRPRFSSALILMTGLLSLTLAESPPVKLPEVPKAEKKVDWKDDPVCQMVFFAVLEGLYTDGVSDECVDAIVPRKPKDGQNPVKNSFVILCPLCHPVYEAFATYQQRPKFNDDGKRNTFGKGLTAEETKKLSSPVTSTRLDELALQIQKWVERKLTSMRLTDAEKKEWIEKLNSRSGEGRTELRQLISKDPAYKGWSMYWGCAACNGTTKASKSIR